MPGEGSCLGPDGGIYESAGIAAISRVLDMLRLVSESISLIRRNPVVLASVLLRGSPSRSSTVADVSARRVLLHPIDTGVEKLPGQYATGRE